MSVTPGGTVEGAAVTAGAVTVPAGAGNPVTTSEPSGTPAEDVTGLKSALAAERKQRADAEKAHKAATAELETLRAASATEAEKALLAARKAERTAADAEWSAKLATSEAGRIRALRLAEIKAQAAGKWHDLSDVVMALSGDESIVVGEGDVVTGVDKALEALAKAKPHWVKPADDHAANGRPNLSAPGGGVRNVTGQQALSLEQLQRDSARRARGMVS